jgi:hypothetical protein
LESEPSPSSKNPRASSHEIVDTNPEFAHSEFLFFLKNLVSVS